MALIDLRDGSVLLDDTATETGEKNAPLHAFVVNVLGHCGSACKCITNKTFPSVLKYNDGTLC